jgi:hypothetical protein
MPSFFVARRYSAQWTAASKWDAVGLLRYIANLLIVDEISPRVIVVHVMNVAKVRIRMIIHVIYLSKQ